MGRLDRLIWNATPLILLALVFVQWSRGERMNDELTNMRPAADRLAVQTRLTGRSLDPEELSLKPLYSLGTLPPPGLELWWFVDTKDCRGCLALSAEWNELAMRGVRLNLVMMSSDSAPGPASLRGYRNTGVWQGRKEWIEAAVGPLLPSTKLLLDGHGQIIQADPRYPAQGCGPSLDAQLLSLLVQRSEP